MKITSLGEEIRPITNETRYETNPWQLQYLTYDYHIKNVLATILYGYIVSDK